MLTFVESKRRANWIPRDSTSAFSAAFTLTVNVALGFAPTLVLGGSKLSVPFAGKGVAVAVAVSVGVGRSVGPIVTVGGRVGVSVGVGVPGVGVTVTAVAVPTMTWPLLKTVPTMLTGLPAGSRADTAASLLK